MAISRLALRHVLCLVCLGLALCSGVRAQTPLDSTSSPPSELDVARSLDGVALGERLGLYEDSSGTLSLEQLLTKHPRFETTPHTAPGFGFTNSAYWVRLRVVNRGESERPWLLELAYPHLDQVTLFVPLGNGEWQRKVTGDHVPFSQRDLDTRNFVFSLSEPAHADRTYYLRVRTSGSLNLPLVAWSTLAFLEHQDRELSVIFMFYGLMLVMAVYNAFIFFFVRQREYLFYALYIVSLLIFQATLNGHTFQHLLGNQIWLANHVLPFSIGLSFTWTALFQANYLNIPESMPGWSRFVKVAAWGSGLLALFGLVGPYAWSIRVLVVTGAVLTMLAPILTYRMARGGHRGAKLYLLAWSALILGVLLYFAKTLGLLPTHFVTTWGIQVGASLEVILLSLALADRINEMRADLAALNARLSANVQRLEEALVRAEEATRAKGDFLATVSHELRTPLNAIINIPLALIEDVPLIEIATCARCQTAFALEEAEQVSAATACPECRQEGSLNVQRRHHFVGAPDQLVKHLGHIERSGKHLLQMVSTILDVSKLEAGKFMLALDQVEVGRLLEDAVEPLVNLAEKTGVKLELSEYLGPGFITADALRLRQVLINLIGNAIKFSNGRGRVSVSAEPEGDHVVFAVRDQGIGVAPEHRERIFRSFEQVDQGDTRRYGGTGLGLSISKSLVELHDGEIWVESEIGRGSTFRFKIPVAGPRKSADEAHTGASAAPAANRSTEVSEELPA
ncbi:MAG: 7TM diverse intracellular signaling domain-containing protein [Myxococcales bacterium]